MCFVSAETTVEAKTKRALDLLRAGRWGYVINDPANSVLVGTRPAGCMPSGWGTNFTPSLSRNVPRIGRSAR